MIENFEDKKTMEKQAGEVSVEKGQRFNKIIPTKAFWPILKFFVPDEEPVNYKKSRRLVLVSDSRFRRGRVFKWRTGCDYY